MALCLLPLLAATAGERTSTLPSAVRSRDRGEVWCLQAVAVGVTLVQATERETLASTAADDEVGPRWRRTAWGWERSELWRVGPPSKPAPMFDPVLFAALQCMLSLMALIAWPDG